jgi:sterol desaturase/sphingolipid hydroxylase (fatty acid hydroxylase superfamily)
MEYLDNLLGMLIPVTFVLALVLERLFRAQNLPKVRFWLVKGIVFFVLTAGVNAVVPMLVAWLVGRHAPLHLVGIGLLPGVLVAFLVGDAVGYLVHRFMHSVPFVWRWSHQMHHSAERMDLAGLSYSHPIDMLLTFGVPGLLVGLLGLDPTALAVAGFVNFLYAVFQHSNVRTPHWLGYVLQRPEMHALHHQRGVHGYNYGNLPLWDALCGTYRNPATFPDAYGFWPGASKRLGAMLLGRDVGTPTK